MGARDEAIKDEIVLIITTIDIVVFSEKTDVHHLQNQSMVVISVMKL